MPIKNIDKNRKIEVMGIINLTDNSYFSQSRCLVGDDPDNVSAVLRRASSMVEEGVDIFDVGACSTGPGTLPTGEDEEWRRLKPALIALKSEFPEIPISVDTYWPSVVRKVYDAIGQFIVNDVSAGTVMGILPEDRPGEMLELCAGLHLPFVAMHMRGTPATMQTLCQYDDVTEDVLAYFRNFARRAEEAGLEEWIVDPGFGFAKTIEQNYELLSNLDQFSEFGRKVLVGISRKSMIYRKFGITPEESLPATQVLHYKALCEGADILRVHDVAEAVRTVELYRALS